MSNFKDTRKQSKIPDPPPYAESMKSRYTQQAQIIREVTRETIIVNSLPQLSQPLNSTPLVSEWKASQFHGPVMQREKTSLPSILGTPRRSQIKTTTNQDSFGISDSARYQDFNVNIDYQKNINPQSSQKKSPKSSQYDNAVQLPISSVRSTEPKVEVSDSKKLHHTPVPPISNTNNSSAETEIQICHIEALQDKITQLKKILTNNSNYKSYSFSDLSESCGNTERWNGNIKVLEACMAEIEKIDARIELMKQIHSRECERCCYQATLLHEQVQLMQRENERKKGPTSTVELELLNLKNEVDELSKSNDNLEADNQQTKDLNTKLQENLTNAFTELEKLRSRNERMRKSGPNWDQRLSMRDRPVQTVVPEPGDELSQRTIESTTGYLQLKHEKQNKELIIDRLKQHIQSLELKLDFLSKNVQPTELISDIQSHENQSKLLEDVAKQMLSYKEMYEMSEDRGITVNQQLAEVLEQVHQMHVQKDERENEIKQLHLQLLRADKPSQVITLNKRTQTVKEEEAAETSKSAREYDQLLENAQNKAKELEEQCNHLQSQINEKDVKIIDMGKRINELFSKEQESQTDNIAIEKYKADLKNSQGQIAELEKRLKELKSEYKNREQTSKKTIEGAYVRISELEKENKELEKVISNKELNALQEQQKTAGRITELEKEIAAAKRESREKEKLNSVALKRAKDAIADLEKRLEEEKQLGNEAKSRLTDGILNDVNAEEERNPENTTEKNSPMKVAEEYKQLCCNEWLDAKRALDESSISYDEENKQRILCSILTDAVKETNVLLETWWRIVQNMLTNPLAASSSATDTPSNSIQGPNPMQGLRPVLHHRNSETQLQGASAARRQQSSRLSNHRSESKASIHSRAVAASSDLDLHRAQSTLFQIPAPLMSLLLEALKTSADRTSLKGLVMRLKSQLCTNYKELCQLLDDGTDTRLLSYIEVAMHVAWKMNLQQPAMTFSQSGIGEAWQGVEQQVISESSRREGEGGADPVVEYYLYPILHHGDILMSPGNVHLK